MRKGRRASVWTAGMILGVALCAGLGGCRSAVKDFYDPLKKPGHCGGAAGATGGTGGDATGGQTGGGAGGQAGGAAGGQTSTGGSGNGGAGQGGECP